MYISGPCARDERDDESDKIGDESDKIGNNSKTLFPPEWYWYGTHRTLKLGTAIDGNIPNTIDNYKY